MYNAHGWWFPDQDTHFAEMLEKNISKGRQPVYQEPVRQVSLTLVKNKITALDIGANVGLWSRDLCKHFQKVIAVEPVAEFRACLQLNVPTDNLQVLPIALGAQNTQINMIITEHNTGHTHVDPDSLGAGNIEMKRLDSLSLPRLDYVKIDCEGYENYILDGAKQTLLRDRPVMVIEDKGHKDVGHNQAQGAVEKLISWGAVIMSRVNNDVVLGWR